MHRSQLAKHAWLLFILLAIAFYFYGLGRLPLVGPDEPRYAEVAREMLARRDFITPVLGGHNWFEKPALLYWMLIASYGAFGVSEWAARVGPACSGLLSVLLVYWCARRVERASAKHSSRRLGVGSGVVLATSMGLIVFSRGATFDVVLTMAVAASLSCFLVSELERDEGRGRWPMIGFYVGVGLALLAKGLVGIVIPFGVAGAYLLMRRRWPDRRLMKSIAWGLPLALAVAGLWYGPMMARHGWEFVDQFFIQQHFARFVSNKYHHTQPFFFYPPVMLLLALPWTAFLVAALARLKGWSFRGDGAEDKLRVFSLAWLIVPILFFSLSGSKLPGYILPALPGAALLAGERLAGFLRGEEGERAMRLTGATLVLFALGLVAYAWRTGDASIKAALLIAALPLLAGACVMAWTNKRELSLSFIVLAVFGGGALAIGYGAERVARRESMRDLLRLASARGYASAPVFQLHTIEHSSEFYAAERVARDADGELVWLENPAAVEEVARRGDGPLLVIVSVWRMPTLTSYRALQSEVIGDNGHLALVVVRPSN